MKKLSPDMMDAILCLNKHGWNGPNSTGISVHSYRGLVRRGLLRLVEGVGQESKFDLTEEGKQWIIERS